jgi:hypothetical protein
MVPSSDFFYFKFRRCTEMPGTFLRFDGFEEDRRVSKERGGDHLEGEILNNFRLCTKP